MQIFDIKLTILSLLAGTGLAWLMRRQISSSAIWNRAYTGFVIGLIYWLFLGPSSPSDAHHGAWMIPVLAVYVPSLVVLFLTKPKKVKRNDGVQQLASGKAE